MKNKKIEYIVEDEPEKNVKTMLALHWYLVIMFFGLWVAMVDDVRHNHGYKFVVDYSLAAWYATIIYGQRKDVMEKTAIFLCRQYVKSERRGW